jgi:hypothetical protein
MTTRESCNNHLKVLFSSVLKANGILHCDLLPNMSYKYNEYSSLTVFTNNNRAVFEVEYGKNTPQAGVMNSLHFISTTRDLDLVSPESSEYVRIPCILDLQNGW